MITVPSKWSKKFGLSANDEVELTEEGSELRVRHDKGILVQSCSVDLTCIANEKLIKRIISSLYIRGVDEISVNYDSPQARELLNEKVSELVGCTVLSETQHGCLIKNIATVHESEFDSVMRRIFYVLLETGHEIHNSAIKCDDRGFKLAVRHEKDVNKLADFCKRVLNKRGVPNLAITTHLYCIVSYLEDISDALRQIGIHYSTKVHAHLSKRTIDYIRTINELLGAYHSLHYNFNLQEAAKFYDLIRAKYGLAYDLFKDTPAHESFMVANLYNVHELIYQALAATFEAKLK